MPCSHLPPADLPDPLRVDDRWLTETALALARGIAADLGFDCLPILADALEDAGCDNFTLLSHLRHEPEHRVECWALRRLLRTTLMLPGDVPMVFAYCPPGSFLMGNLKATHGDEFPVRRVVLTKGFYAGLFPVTQEQWRAVMGVNPSRFRGDRRPVEQVDWMDATVFCATASEAVGRLLRLPTESEWEYACRAGTETRFHFGDDFRAGQVNCRTHYGRARRDRENQTSDVGTLRPNDWGLFDCHGNVREWCADLYDNTFYARGPRMDPICDDGDDLRVCRGGSWRDNGYDCRSTSRKAARASTCDDGTGFRVVFTAT